MSGRREYPGYDAGAGAGAGAGAEEAIDDSNFFNGADDAEFTAGSDFPEPTSEEKPAQEDPPAQLVAPKECKAVSSDVFNQMLADLKKENGPLDFDEMLTKIKVLSESYPRPTSFVDKLWALSPRDHRNQEAAAGIVVACDKTIASKKPSAVRHASFIDQVADVIKQMQLRKEPSTNFIPAVVYTLLRVKMYRENGLTSIEDPTDHAQLYRIMNDTMGAITNKHNLAKAENEPLKMK